MVEYLFPFVWVILATAYFRYILDTEYQLWQILTK